MVATHYDMGSEKFSSGLTRDFLKTLTWKQIIDVKGIRLAMIAKDLERYDLRPEIRLNPEVFKKFRPKERGIDIGMADVFDNPLTTEWRTVRPEVAIRLNHDMREDVNLGGPGMVPVVMDDGTGGKMVIPQATQGFPGLIEFRMPCEVPPKEGE